MQGSSSSYRGARGQGLVEYGLVIGLVALLVVAAFTLLGIQTSSLLAPPPAHTTTPSSESSPSKPSSPGMAYFLGGWSEAPAPTPTPGT